jgi:hypothetical protein
MNRAYLFFGWKIDAGLALRYLEEENADQYDWFYSEIDDNVFLTHACPASGLNIFDCDFYVVMGEPRNLPYDADDMFDMLRDRALLERAWAACRRVCRFPPDVRFTSPEIHAVVHFY